MRPNEHCKQWQTLVLTESFWVKQLKLEFVVKFDEILIYTSGLTVMPMLHSLNKTTIALLLK